MNSASLKLRVFEVEYIKKKGKDLFVFGKQIVVLDVRGLYYMKKELEKGVEKPDEMLYDAGRLSLMEIHESLVASLGDAAETILADRESALDMLVDALNNLGLGEISVLEFKPEIKFAVKHSAGAQDYVNRKEMSRHPVCYALAGMFSGVCEKLLQTPVACKETKCIACGDEVCEFVIEKSKHGESDENL
jgi:predicted hydrocarbon binding protein